MIGDVTEEMQEHHSSALIDEKRDAMTPVAAKLVELREVAPGGTEGDPVGDKARNKAAA